MKELYFTAESLERKAREIQQEICSFVRAHPFSFVFKNSALLILDMQVYFLDPSSHAYIPSAAAIVPNLQELIRVYARYNQPILFTRHTNNLKDSGRMASWWKELIRIEDPASEIISELDTSAGTILQKSQYDAFYHTSLEELLINAGIQQVVIAGVMTHLCCETTARSAFTRGFEVFFLVDGTATYNERFHRASVLNLSHGFAVPALTSEILAVTV
jgi:isochorismate hydrolase